MHRFVLKTVVFLLLGICLSTATFGQVATLKSGSKQAWSGGQCCSYGVNYVFTIDAGPKPKAFRLDSDWVGDMYFVPSEDDYSALQVDFDTLSGLHYIYANEAHIEIPSEISPDMDPGTENPYVKKPRYHGEAMIVYHLNGRKRRLTIPELTELPMIAYP